MSVHGEQQGLISQDCLSDSPSEYGVTTQGDNHLIYIHSYRHSLERTPGLIHHPVTLTKPIDASSPRLVTAMENKERLQCTLDFYLSHDETLPAEKYYSVELTGALVQDLTMQVQALPGEAHNFIESFRLSYQQIRWQHHPSAVSRQIEWRDTVL